MSNQDPFLQAQADILALLNQCRPLLQSYLRIRSSASSANSPELVEARQELESTLEDLGADLQDLVDSVRAVEGDPYKYGLDVDEVNRRRKLVEDVGKEVEGMRKEMKATVAEAQRKRSASLAHPDSFAASVEDGDPLAGNDDYAEWEEQRQMEIMQEQDQALDGVFQTVGNLRQQADTMGRELEEQAEMLEDTDGIADRVGGKLARGMKSIRFVVERNEGEFQECPVDCRSGVRLADNSNRQMVGLLHWLAHLCLDHSVDTGVGIVMAGTQTCTATLGKAPRGTSTSTSTNRNLQDNFDTYSGKENA